MRRRNIIGFLFLIAIAAIGTTITVIHSQKSTESTLTKQEKLNIGDLPVAEYDAILPTDLSEKAERVKRNKHRNLKIANTEDAKKFMIAERRDSAYGGFGTHEPNEPAIPAAKSDVIIIGEVIEAAAFLSEDKVSVYSEFEVKIGEVLKNTNLKKFFTGGTITTYRGGGAVRFQSGKIIDRLFGGKPMPKLKHTYLFFLNFNVHTDDYTIVTAYELVEGRVTPLDGIDIDGSAVRELASHQSYKGESVADFLTHVRKAIDGSRDIFESERS